MQASPDYQVVVKNVEELLGQMRVTRATLSKLFEVSITPVDESARTLGQGMTEVDIELKEVSCTSCKQKSKTEKANSFSQKIRLTNT